MIAARCGRQNFQIGCLTGPVVRCRYRPSGQLAFNQAFECALHGDQFRIGTDLNHLSPIQHDDPVGLPDGRQAMGDDQPGYVLAGEIVGHQFLGFIIKPAGRFVEQQNLGHGHQLGFSAFLDGIEQKNFGAWGGTLKFDQTF